MKLLDGGKKRQKNTLFCFTPEVMIATFVIEILLALYTFVKARSSKFGRGAIFILIFLALFQLAEYQICRGENPEIWSRIGLFSITILPILGIYLISILDKRTWLHYLGYGLGVAFGLYFVLVPKAIDGVACGGNYVIFSGPQALFNFYSFYYFGFLLFAIWESFHRAQEEKINKTLRRILFWFIVGYLSFLLPLTLVYLFVTSARIAVASIMCGFAVIFALILALKIVPLYQKLEKNKSK